VSGPEHKPLRRLARPVRFGPETNPRRNITTLRTMSRRPTYRRLLKGSGNPQQLPQLVSFPDDRGMRRPRYLKKAAASFDKFAGDISLPPCSVELGRCHGPIAPRQNRDASAIRSPRAQLAASISCPAVDGIATPQRPFTKVDLRSHEASRVVMPGHVGQVPSGY